jgi:hypothetical protein
MLSPFFTVEIPENQPKILSLLDIRFQSRSVYFKGAWLSNCLGKTKVVLVHFNAVLYRIKFHNSTGIVSACHRENWSSGSWDRIPSGHRVVGRFNKMFHWNKQKTSPKGAPKLFIKCSKLWRYHGALHMIVASLRTLYVCKLRIKN